MLPMRPQLSGVKAVGQAGSKGHRPGLTTGLHMAQALICPALGRVAHLAICHVRPARHPCRHTPTAERTTMNM